MKLSREELTDLIYKPEEFKEFIENEDLSHEDAVYIINMMREIRLNDLFADLNIDEEKLEKVKKSKITLSPTSTEWPLFSEIFQHLEGEFEVGELFNAYYSYILQKGMHAGTPYGVKFAIEDIQNGDITIEEIKKMSKDELFEYVKIDRE